MANMANQNINVKIIKTVGARNGGCPYITIDIVLDETTGDKYFIVEDDCDRTGEILIYKYPDVNEQIYAIMNLIEFRGGSYIDDQGYLYGPNLPRNVTTPYGVCYIGFNQYCTIELNRIVTKNTQLESHEYYQHILQRDYNN